MPVTAGLRSWLHECHQVSEALVAGASAIREVHPSVKPKDLPELQAIHPPERAFDM